MDQLCQRAWNLSRSEESTTSVEYALMIALICVAAITALASFGVRMDSLFLGIESTVPTADGS